MSDYKERRSDGFSPRGKRERVSFNPNFGSDNKLKSRPRFNKNGDERQRMNGGNEDFGRAKQFTFKNRGSNFNDGETFRQSRSGGEFKPRYGSVSNQYGSRQGFRSNSGFSHNEKAYGTRPYSGNQAERRPAYSNNGNRRGAYDPNAKYSNKKRAAYREATIDPNAPLRLNKYLSNAGMCSRREADNYITAGLVTVNGVVVTELGTKVMPTDDVRFNNERINPERKVYVLLNKPKDCVTTVDDPQERKTVIDCLRGIGKERIYPVGRLDRNTTGVLLLTNDGDLASKLTHPKFMKKKIYHVTCDKNVAMSDMDMLVNGIELEDGPVYADEVTYVNDADRSQIGIEIHSGKNRIVRRMLEHLGYRVNKLDRVLFAGLTKKNLRRGDWRYLTEKEVNMLRMGAYE